MLVLLEAIEATVLEVVVATRGRCEGEQRVGLIFEREASTVGLSLADPRGLRSVGRWFRTTVRASRLVRVRCRDIEWGLVGTQSMFEGVDECRSRVNEYQTAYGRDPDRRRANIRLIRGYPKPFGYCFGPRLPIKGLKETTAQMDIRGVRLRTTSHL